MISDGIIKNKKPVNQLTNILFDIKCDLVRRDERTAKNRTNNWNWESL